MGKQYEEMNLKHSGYKERYYFGAVYVRLCHILFELSSDEPGFTIDEPYETLGESLALPKAFEGNREKKSKRKFVYLTQQLIIQINKNQKEKVAWSL